MNKKLFITILGVCLFWAGALFGQDNSNLTFRYDVPLPESTFRGDWQFHMEAGTVEDQPYQIQLNGYNPLGALVFQENSNTMTDSSVFTWDLTEELAAKRVQSLVVTSDAPLKGALWMWNDLSGLFNGVSLNEQTAQSLVIRHIPSNFFAWNTSVSVMGVAPAGVQGDVTFSYSDNTSLNQEGVVWRGLNPGGVYVGTPNHNILIGGLDNNTFVTWGLMGSTDRNFLLSGYQSFFRNDDIVQGAALELAANGQSQGYVGFSNDRHYDELFAFTNPSAGQVTMTFVLGHRVGDDLRGYTTETVKLTRTIGAYQRQNLILGSADFFPGVTQPLFMQFDAVTATGEPADVHAVHMQSNESETLLGAHAFVPEAGGRTVFHMDGSDRFESLVEIYNPGNVPSLIEVRVLDSEGQIYVTDFELPALDVKRDLCDIILANTALDPAKAYRVDLRRLLGSRFFIKVSRYRSGDVALVDSPMTREVRTIPELKN